MQAIIVVGNSNSSFSSNPFPKKPWALHVSNKSFENTVEKGKIARNERFLVFPQCFLPFWRNFCRFHQIQNCRLQSLSV